LNIIKLNDYYINTNDNCGSILFRLDFFGSIRLKAFSMQNRSVKRNSSDA